MTASYSVKYTVSAETRLEAINAAVAKLRSTLRLVAVVSADPAGPPWWVVRLKVADLDA